jgi:hypothetical protein
MFRSIARTVRRLTRPVSRPAALFLLWSHRRTIALWFRSIRDEIGHARQQGRFDPARWKRLIAALWRVSQESDLLRENELRRLVVTGDEAVVADVGEPWPERRDFERVGVEPISFAESAGQFTVRSV